MADDRVLVWFRCFSLYLFFSLVQASTQPPIQICGAANYDVRNLTARIWRFPLAETEDRKCLTPKTGNTTEGCTITMAFCRSVAMAGTCGSAAVCETYHLPNNNTYSLSAYSPYVIPFNTTALAAGSGFTTQYPNGEVYTKSNNTNCTLSTAMTFHCKKSAVWDIESTQEVLLVPVEPRVQFIEGPEICTYTMEFDFAGACPIYPPSGTVTQLSAGSVLLIIFFVSLSIYFVVGVVVNVARGRTGQGIIPHSHFWIELPALIKDGIHFSLTCGGAGYNRQSYERIG